MTALLAARGGNSKAVAAFCATMLVAGCAASPTDRGPSPEDSRPSSPDTPELLKEAMPTKADFPGNWHVEAQDAPPVSLPGLDDGSTVVDSAVPDECQGFAAEFVAAPGSTIPGEFVSSTIAMIPNAEGVFDQSSVVVFATKGAGAWGSPRSVQDRLRPCREVAAQISIRGRKVDARLSSVPIDTSGVKGEAAGRATIIDASEAHIRMAVVRATTKGVLVSASSMIVSESGGDQRELLVRLVAKTVDKLNAIR